jgi:hypothetical protein
MIDMEQSHVETEMLQKYRGHAGQNLFPAKGRAVFAPG